MQNENNTIDNFEQITIKKKLFQAIQEKNIHKILELDPPKKLLKEPYDPNNEERGWSFLHHAASYSNNDAVIRCLVFQYGIDVDTPDKRGRSPIFAAISSRNWTNILSLKACGANPNLIDHKNNSPLSEALSTADENKLTLKCLIIGCDAEQASIFHSLSMEQKAKLTLCSLPTVVDAKEAKIDLLKEVTLAEIAQTKRFLEWTKDTYSTNATSYNSTAFNSPAHGGASKSTLTTQPQEEQKSSIQLTYHSV